MNIINLIDITVILLYLSAISYCLGLVLRADSYDSPVGTAQHAFSTLSILLMLMYISTLL